MKKVAKFDSDTNNRFATETYEGEDIHEKVDRLLTTDQPIEEDTSFKRMYTLRKEGVIPEYNVRTDKWDMALDTMDKVNRTKIAKAEQYTKDTETDQPTEPAEPAEPAEPKEV